MFLIHLNANKQLEAGMGRPPNPLLHALAVHRLRSLILAVFVSRCPCPLRTVYVLVSLCPCPLRKRYSLVFLCPCLLRSVNPHPLTACPLNIIQHCMVPPCTIPACLQHMHLYLTTAGVHAGRLTIHGNTCPSLRQLCSSTRRSFLYVIYFTTL